MMITENIIHEIPGTVPINRDIGAATISNLSTEDLYDRLELRKYELDWLKRKDSILQLATVCQKSVPHQGIAKRLKQCGKFHLAYEINGQLRITNASHCKCRPCPECQQYRQHQQTKKFSNWIGSLLNQRPDLIFIYVSVGYRNVPIKQISEMNRQLHEGLARLFRKNKAFEIEGSVTFFHFTVPNSTEIHFDTHSIIAIDPAIFESSKYHRNAFWSELFQKRFRLDYRPDVDVEQIGLRTGDLKEELIKAFSYGAGPLNFSIESETSKVTEDSTILELIDGFALSHSIVPTGLFRTFPKTVPEPVNEELKPVMKIWMDEQMSITDLRKKNKTSTTRGN